MKVRMGFVSNSSSSSFVIVTSVENHERVIKQLNDLEKAVVNAMMYKRSGTFFGREIMVGEEVSSENWYTLSELDIEVEVDCEDEIYDAWAKYRKLVIENKDEVFTCQVNF